MTFGPNSRRQLSIADARCSAHDTAAATGAKNALRRQSSMSASRLSRRIASDGTTPWLIISARISVSRGLRNVERSMSDSVSARMSSCPSGRSTPRTMRETRARDGRVRIILRMITTSSGASGPPRAHHTTPPMIAGRKHDRCGPEPDAFRRRRRRRPRAECDRVDVARRSAGRRERLAKIQRLAKLHDRFLPLHVRS